MLFNSFIFFIFLGVVLPVFYLLSTKRSKNVYLLLISYIFYGYWDWRFCFLLTFTTVVDYFIGHKIFQTQDPAKKKAFLIISLIVNLGVLGFFKYFNFFADNLQEICALFGTRLDYTHLYIILPVGLSFYTFHNISYIVDVYKNKLEPTRDIVDFGLFVVFFPQLVAGPIGRATALMPQLSKKLQPTKLQIQEGIVLIISGLFRKVVLGDTSGRFVDHIFGDLGTYKSIEILCGLILFTVQIYADFSGYSHLARGTAKLFGVELMINFEQPYLSRNIAEFWSTWHISLSTWLRDYLYIPLGGNRKGKTKTYINLMITMLIGGLWHGASWNFVIYGGLHGVYLSVHRFFVENKTTRKERINFFDPITIGKIIFTFIIATFTRIFFRSTTWESTHLFFSRVIHWEPSEYSFWFITTTLTYILLVFILDIIEYTSRNHAQMLYIRPKSLRNGLLAGMFVFTLCFMFQIDALPFYYFKF